MRIANVAGRAVMAHGKEPIDVFEASGGRFGPSRGTVAVPLFSSLEE